MVFEQWYVIGAVALVKEKKETLLLVNAALEKPGRESVRAPFEIDITF